MPTLCDVRENLQSYVDNQRNAVIEEIAQFAVARLQKWTRDPDYAGLFNRCTTIDMSAPCLHCNRDELVMNGPMEAIAPLTVVLLNALTTRSDDPKKSITVLNGLDAGVWVADACNDCIADLPHFAQAYLWYLDGEPGCRGLFGNTR